ncbi:hypothetical protein JCGZ_16522 [Jatropha curcas]|uniref:Uncharacterized protein n=1 Tax=Jatropha curcas TaxID=180498 RepID=A0A067K251_JATCU|nr:hypothetical protein JCGZ_16522 [Jatropha curcas]
MNRDSCYSLLGWGLARLFNKLDDFHQCKTLASGSKIYSEWPFLDNVLQELLDQLLCNREDEPSIYSFISKAQQDAGAYTREISVIDEKEVQDTGPPALFWINLLGGRHPCWCFLCQSSTRIRRKVNYVDNLSSESELENHVVAKKRRNVPNNQGDPIYQKSRLKRKRSLVVAGKEHEITAGKRYKSFLVADSSTMHPVADDIKGAPEVNVVEFEKENVQPALLKSSQPSVKLEITELCDVLKLPVCPSALIGVLSRGPTYSCALMTVFLPLLL